MAAISVQSNKRCIALGFFDGVHTGHKVLLRRTAEIASELGVMPSVLTFDMHPDTVISGLKVPLLTDAAARKNLIARVSGIEDVIVIPFDRSTMNTPWESFASYLVSGLGAVGVVVGFDFTFGAGGEGNAEKLSQWCIGRGIRCEVIPPVIIDGTVVSSTQIRNLLSEGNAEAAAGFLGHPFCLENTAHSKWQTGRILDAPVVRMCFPDGVIVPGYGVYASRIVFSDGTEQDAVTKIGVCPSFGDGNPVFADTLPLRFPEERESSPVRLDFYSFLRLEQKYSAAADLADQIRQDMAAAENYFARMK